MSPVKFGDGRTLFALLGVLLLAAILRIWGLDYGLPHPLSRPDEERIVGRAQTIFATGNWHPGSFFYPSLVFYADTAALHGYYAVKKWMGDYDRPFDFLFEIAVTRPGLHYLLGRWVGAVSGIMTVLVVYALGLSVSGLPAVGLLAAALLATCHLHVRESHFATVDVVRMTLFIASSLLFAVRAASKPSYGNYLLGGLFIGLSVSTKYNAGLVALGLVVASFYALSSLDKKSVALRLGAAGLVAFLAFALTSPYVLLHYQGFFANMEGLGSFLYRQGGPAIWDHLRTTFPAGLGWPLFLVSIAGVLRALRNRRPGDLVLLAFVIPFFILISGVRVTFPRYVVPLVPALVVLAADTAVSLVERVGARKRWLWVLAIAVLATPGLARSIRYDRIASREDTRLLAAEWIAANVRPQTKILVCKGYGGPAVNEDRRRPPAFVVQKVDCSSTTDPSSADGQYLVTHEHDQLTAFSGLGDTLRAWLSENASLQTSFDPYRPAVEVAPIFYPSDAFYIPFDGYDGVERGGPRIGIWKMDAR